MKDEHCPACDKNALWGGMCRQHHWMHVIIKILVAIFIFWCGVQFGELKSAIRAAYLDSGYGYGMMSAYGGRGQVYGGPAMMGGWTYTTASEATTTQKK